MKKEFPTKDNQQLVLGLYSGDHQTVALLANSESRILARGISAHTSDCTSGIAGRLPAIEHAIDEIFIFSGGQSVPVDKVWIGIAGLGRMDEQELTKSFHLEQLRDARVQISSGAELVLAAGTPQGWGIAISSGNTSLVVGKDRDGKLVKAGGWGQLLGEAGSAFAIGMSAVQHFTRAADGRINSHLLMDNVMSYWNLTDPRALYRKVYIERTSTTDFIGLAEVVFKTAEAGDAAAQEILYQTASNLASLAAATARKLGLSSKIPCAVFGPILSENFPIRGEFIEETRKLGFELDPIHEVEDPALGAIRLAMSCL